MPEMRRYKHYQVDCDEEDAIEQAELCLRLLLDRATDLDECNRNIIVESYKTLQAMRIKLSNMGATCTTMAYN